MLITLQIKHIVPSIHIVYVVEAHEMKMLNKNFTSEGFLIPINNGHDYKNLTFRECNSLRIVSINIRSNLD